MTEQCEIQYGIRIKPKEISTCMEQKKEPINHIFIVGSKSIGQYGGYETFVDRLTEQHKDNPAIQYHIACKANGDGYMDESKLTGIKVL